MPKTNVLSGSRCAADRDLTHKLVASLYTLYQMQEKLGERAALVVMAERRVSGLAVDNPLLRSQRKPVTAMLKRTYELVQRCVVGQAGIAIQYLKRCDGPLRPLYGDETASQITLVMKSLLELQQWAFSSARVLLASSDRPQRLFEEAAAFGRVVNHRWPIVGELPSPAMFTSKRTTPQVREQAVAYVKLNGWIGRNAVAEEIGCPPSTLSKAVKTSIFLQARKAEYEAEKGGRRQVQVSQDELDRVTAEREIKRLAAESKAEVQRDERQRQRRSHVTGHAAG